MKKIFLASMILFVSIFFMACSDDSDDDGTVYVASIITAKSGSASDSTTISVEHSYDDGVVTKEATCTEAGVKTYTCSKCGDTKTEEIAATGHTWDGIVCTVCGVYSIELSKTGTEYTDAGGLTLVLNTFTHTESDGYKEYSINYTLTNSVSGSEIGPGLFKIIYKTASGYDSSFQTGVFNNLYYGGTLTKTYSWKLTSDKTFVCLEYMSDSQTTKYIFSDEASADLLNWVVE